MVLKFVVMLMGVTALTICIARAVASGANARTKEPEFLSSQQNCGAELVHEFANQHPEFCADRK